ncbi:hypothetical protein [Dysgonomonas macrotermitis]|uniref:Uncharacterized protein n=1 Tax=Dysgonomonas macrotermitis TaxID=1346286 RepID=A0A1M4VUM9_9BACT|nr:hypothetical protein [Dysgonomonas macrotermitis]SHE72744.1 hypothetical protein SAMN05444362_10248 [Dysgonomonas macrotermitis]
MRNIFVLTSFVILFLLGGCEYNNEESYHNDVQKPEDITIDINLDGISNGQTIYIYAPTKLHYLYDFKSKNILEHEIKLGNEIIQPDSDGIIEINPERYSDNEEIQLTIKVELATGSNSIAEKLGYEKYVGDYNYKIKISKNASFTLDFKDEITDERYLKVFWALPPLEQVEVDYYDVFYRDENGTEKKVTTITDPTQTFFIDESYTSGYRRYLVMPYFKNDRMVWQYNYYTKQDDYPSYNIVSEPIGLNKIKVTWGDNKYRCRYALEYLDGTIIDCGEKTEIEIEHNYSFPVHLDVKLHTIPLDFTGSIERTPYSMQNITSKKIGNIRYPMDFDFNLKDSQLYVYDEGKLLSVDLKEMQILRSRSVLTLWDWGKKNLAYSNYLEKLVFAEHEKFMILNKGLDSISTVHAKLTQGTQVTVYSILCLSKDNRVVTCESGNSGKTLKIYDISTNKFMYSEQLGYGPAFLSKDGDILCSMAGLAIGYKVGQTELQVISKTKVDLSKYKDSFFSQFQNEILYMIEDDNFYKLNIVTGERIGPINGKFITEDPFTGNIVLERENEMVTIMNFQLDRTLLTLPAITNIQPRLYDNILLNAFSGALYYLDLKPYIKN